MTSNNQSRRYIDRVQVSEQRILLLLVVALLGFMALSAALIDSSVTGPAQGVVDSSVTQFDLGITNEADSSIDPFAPYFGDGDPFEQSGIYYHQHQISEGGSAACFLAIPCW